MTPGESHYCASIPARLAGAAFWPIGAAYGLAMHCRRTAYRNGWLRSEGTAAPVICVGNLTVGGTGKTPMVAWLVGQLQSAGRRPAILTRGYKAVAGQSDEAALLAKLTAVPVIANADRLSAARQAQADGADVLVMDDGFQHLRLRRDFNIVLFDATNPFGGGFWPGAPLPAGRMRESLRALADAHAVVLTRSDLIPPERLADLWSRLAERAPKALLATAEHKPTAVIDPAGRSRPVDILAGRKVFLFCGLGNPEGFLRTAELLRADVVGVRRLGDHAHYTPKILRGLLAEAKRLGANLLLTTQKDGVKLPTEPTDPPIHQLAVEMDLTDGRAELLDAIQGVLHK
ncbi:MAG: tetraacyldisaccharide 4'-kinase [Phycisphaerae bacterium]|nr:tetraacyldisaccharide 4'-kinase [Phycisphaerae bacterium]